MLLNTGRGAQMLNGHGELYIWLKIKDALGDGSKPHCPP